MRTCGTAATTAAGTQQRGEAAEREHGGVGRAPGLTRQARGIPSSSMATISGTEGGEDGTCATGARSTAMRMLLSMSMFLSGRVCPFWCYGKALENTAIENTPAPEQP